MEARPRPACTPQNGQAGRRPCLEVSAGILELLQMHRQHSCTTDVPGLLDNTSLTLMPYAFQDDV